MASKRGGQQEATMKSKGVLSSKKRRVDTPSNGVACKILTPLSYEKQLVDDVAAAYRYLFCICFQTLYSNSKKPLVVHIN